MLAVQSPSRSFCTMPMTHANPAAYAPPRTRTPGRVAMPRGSVIVQASSHREDIRQRLKTIEPLQKQMSIFNGSSGEAGPTASLNVFGRQLTLSARDLPVFEALSCAAALGALQTPLMRAALDSFDGQVVPSTLILIGSLGAVIGGVQVSLSGATRALERHVKELRDELCKDL